jgi:hypothetical protein
MLVAMRNATWRVVAYLVALVEASCGGDARLGSASNEPEASPSTTPTTPPTSISAVLPATWEKLPAPPLSGRVAAVVASVGDTIVVVGGWDFLCPPNADCSTSNATTYADGAAYDPSAGQWRAIAAAPLGVRSAIPVVVGGDVYALSQCDQGPLCPAGYALVRYRSEADEWDLLPVPDAMASYGLAAVSGGVVAYSQSDESGVRPDYRFLAAEDRWVALSNDPFPAVYDRTLVEYAGRFMLFGTPITGGDTTTKLAAAYDPETDTWEELASAAGYGFQVWRAGPRLYLNPHFRNAGGGIYDPDSNLWSPLPDPPYNDLAGVIGSDEASYAYAYASGWVLDTRTGAWLEIEPRPDSSAIYDAVTGAAPNLGFVVFGGQTWASGEGQLVNDTWLWKPPPVIEPSP